jgi:predicted DCC family thiol-disulfide oxidoreductase YuxK
VADASTFAAWGPLLIKYLLVLMYSSAALSKLSRAGMDWLNGDTLQYYILQDALRWKSEFGLWLGQYHSVVRMLSWITLGFEATFFLLLIFPVLAWVYAPLGFVLHIGIHLTMRAAFFQVTGLYCVLLPWSWLIQHWFRTPKFPKLESKLAILFDGQCAFCITSMTFLRYCDWADRLKFVDFEREWPREIEERHDVLIEKCRHEMHVITVDGSVRTGFFAFRELLWYLPPLVPLLGVFYFPFASSIAPRIYGFIASRRSRSGACTFQQCSISKGSQEI